MKTCKECGQSFPLDAFPKAGNKGTGRRSRCRPCFNRYEHDQRVQKALAAGAPFKPRVKPDPSSGARLCRSCEQTKPLEHFAKGQRECRACRAARGAAYRTEHAERERARHAREYRAGGEALRAKHRAWRRRAYYADPEGQRAASRAYWNGLTPEERLATLRRQRESRYRSWALWRARQLNSQTGPISRRGIIERDRSTCYLCVQAVAPDMIHLDHVVPLSRGGTHTEDNIKVTCQFCNHRKGSRLLSELDLSQFRTAS